VIFIGILSDDFEEFMIVTVNIAPFSTRNKFGESAYGADVSTTAILLETITPIIDKDNVRIDSTSKIFIDGNITCDEKSKITFNGKTPMIKKVTSLRDETGIYCKIIYL